MASALAIVHVCGLGSLRDRAGRPSKTSQYDEKQSVIEDTHRCLSAQVRTRGTPARTAEDEPSNVHIMQIKTRAQVEVTLP